VRISIEYVQLLSPSHDSINKVVLADPDALKTIRALSARQNAGLRSWSADFIEGKGSGQIILLHGQSFDIFIYRDLTRNRPSWCRENLYCR
jgi:hypothetical protein